MKPAFSTVATPEWTIPQVISAAARLGYEGVEFRTFGAGATGREIGREVPGGFVPEPMLTHAAKVADLCEDAGVRAMGLATSVSFDAVVFPPILGRAIGDFEKSVKQTKEVVEQAIGCGASYVRVFGFEVQKGEPRNRALRRILERLDLAIRTTRHTGVLLAMENGGSFPRGADVAYMLGQSGRSDVVCEYSIAAAHAGGERPGEGFDALGERLAVVKVSDHVDGVSCRLGEGQVPVREAMVELGRRGYAGWVVYELPRAWMGADERQRVDAEGWLGDGVEKLYRWWGEGRGVAERSAVGSAVGSAAGSRRSLAAV
jgi:sugar phosphate isomerase/epimerase